MRSPNIIAESITVFDVAELAPSLINREWDASQIQWKSLK